jgi:hypothetical protein
VMVTNCIGIMNDIPALVMEPSGMANIGLPQKRTRSPSEVPRITESTTPLAISPEQEVAAEASVVLDIRPTKLARVGEDSTANFEKPSTHSNVNAVGNAQIVSS